MGLRETIQNAAASAIGAVGDLAPEIDYKQVITPTTLSPATGVNKTISVHKGIAAVAASYKSREIDGDSIRDTDQKFLIPANSITFTPQQGDEIESGTDTWRVQNKEIDPAGALWTLQARRVN